MTTQLWNDTLAGVGRDFAAATWRDAPPGHTTEAVKMLQTLQNLARYKRLCAADIQRVITALILDVGGESGRA